MKTVWFDSTFGYPWVTALVGLFLMRRDRQPFLRHIFEVSKEGEADDQWIVKINGGERIVISGDQGRTKPRLPTVCKQQHITHIILTPHVHRMQKFERARAIIVVWPQILETFTAPPGSRFQIGRAKSDYILTAEDTHGRPRKHTKS